jgi:adenosine deaminase
MNRFTEEIFAQALAGDLFELNAVPKAEFHSHLLLSAPLHSYPEVGGKRATPPPPRFPCFKEFDQFLFAELFPRMSSADNLRTIMRAALEGMADAGVVYTETSIDLFAAPLVGLRWDQLAEVLDSELNRLRPRLTVQLDLGLARGAKERPWQELLKPALATGLFSGVDLYGEESAAEVAEFAPLFDSARASGLRVKLHTGEQRHGERALQEISEVRPHALQHGVTAAKVAHFVEAVRESNIPLHICPTSNVHLCVAPSYEKHPIRTLFDAGVSVTINTDDIAVFNQSLSQEYLHLYRVGLFDVDELEKIRADGLRLAGVL